MNILEQIKSICDGIEYSRDIPEEAKKQSSNLAAERNMLTSYFRNRL
jgi:hypothetical protein